MAHEHRCPCHRNITNLHRPTWTHTDPFGATTPSTPQHGSKGLFPCQAPTSDTQCEVKTVQRLERRCTVCHSDRHCTPSAGQGIISTRPTHVDGHNPQVGTWLGPAAHYKQNRSTTGSNIHVGLHNSWLTGESCSCCFTPSALITVTSEAC